MDRAKSVVTAERFAQGMTFDQYVNYVGTPENLQREAGWLLGPQRIDFSGRLREWYKQVGLSDAQTSAIRWLAAQPNGPAKILAISEEWSSDCRRDVPMLAHVTDAGGMELRIFPRDGQKVGRDAKANPADSPNADIMNEFLYEKGGQTFQSIPVAVFYTKELRWPARCAPRGRGKLHSRRGTASSATGGRFSCRRSSRCGRPLRSTRSSRRSTRGSSSARSRSGRRRQLPPAIFAASPVSFTMCRPVLARSAR